MDPVIVMVGRVNESVYDVEVMPDVPALELADAIAQALGWPDCYDIEVDGKRLSPHQSLAEAGVWDGAHLVFLPSSRKPPARQSSTLALDLKNPTVTPEKNRKPLQQPASENTSAASAVRKLAVPQPGQEASAAATPQVSWKPMGTDPKVEANSAPSSPVTGWKHASPAEPDNAQNPSGPDDGSGQS